jgi:hypothetical protein
MYRTNGESKVMRTVKRNVVRRKQALVLREYIKSVKLCGCQLCGYSKCISAIEFHHVGRKEFELSSIGSRSLKQVQLEISKCVVICANCHREIHEDGNGWVNRDIEKEVVDNQAVLAFSEAK